MICAHSRPTFGCRSCVTNDRSNWAAARYAEWRAGYLLPKCSECSAVMAIDPEYYFVDGLLTVDVFCPKTDSEGDKTCWNSIAVALE